MGAGFLATKGNGALVEVLRSGRLDSQDYYRELLRLVYRLIFLFTAEDRRDEESGRELLLDPAAPEEAVERYRRYYSTVRLRSFAGRRRGSRHPDLWVGLRRVVAALGSDGAPSLGLPALGSFLFGLEACPNLDASELANDDLLEAVRALATIEEDRRLRLVDYRNLGAEELGGIYEGLLELHPRIELDANPPRFAGHRRRQRAQVNRFVLHPNEPHQLPARLGPRPGRGRGGQGPERPGRGGRHPRTCRRRSGRGFGPLPDRRRTPPGEASCRGPVG